jgi:recombination protein RecR
LCEICRDKNRDTSLLCVVEHAPDVLNFERCGAFRGRYHVLGGLLSPLDGIGPEELRIPSLISVAKKNQAKEVILGFGTDARGETTAIYLAKELAPLGVKITRLATGVAAGSGLEFVDSITLGQALSHRRSMER